MLKNASSPSVRGARFFRRRIQRDARVLLDNLAHLEFHGLVVAIVAGGLDAIRFELLDDVGFGALQSGAAGLAAFHVVVGEDFYVVPPSFAVEVIFRGLLSESGHSEAESERKQHQRFLHDDVMPPIHA